MLCLAQWFPNFSGARNTWKSLVLREGEKIDFEWDWRTTWANPSEHQWSAEQTLGITGIACLLPQVNGFI